MILPIRNQMVSFANGHLRSSLSESGWSPFCYLDSDISDPPHPKPDGHLFAIRTPHTCTYSQTCTHTNTHTRTHTLSLSLAHCLSVCIFVHTYKHTLKHTYARACAHAHTHTQTNTLTKKFIFILSIEIFVLLYPIIIYSTNIWKVLYEISSLILGSE